MWLRIYMCEGSEKLAGGRRALHFAVPVVDSPIVFSQIKQGETKF
jgi:hypothetical protein